MRPLFTATSLGALLFTIAVVAGMVPTARAQNQPPIVEFIAPREPVYEQPTPVGFLARAEDYDGRLASVAFRVDDRTLVTLPPNAVSDVYRFDWTNAPVGEYRPTVVAIDQLGAVTTVELPAFRVLPPNVRPRVRIVQPTNGVELVGPARLRVEVDAQDPDGELREVRLTVGATLVATATNFPPSFELESLTDGRYCLSAEAIDDRGASTISEPVCVNVRTPALRYRLIDLGEFTGTRESRAQAINDAGQVTGYAPEGDATDRAFRLSTHPVQGTRFEFLPFDPAVEAAVSPVRTYGWAINALGQIAGFGTGTNQQDAALFFDGSRTVMTGSPDGDGGATMAYGINRHGTIVGMTRAQVGDVPRRHAFLRRPGGETVLLSDPNWSASQATDINDRGLVVGSFEVPVRVEAFAYDSAVAGSERVGLGTLGPDYPSSRALAVDETGRIIGWSMHLNGDLRAFLYEAGTMIDLGSLGGGISVAQGLNDAGAIVGHSWNFDREQVACLWLDRVPYDLNRLVVGAASLRLIEATGINRTGQIIGWGVRVVDNQEQRRAFLLVPSPEVEVSGEPRFNRQSGLYEQTVQVRNPGPATLEATRLLVRDLPDRIHLANARPGLAEPYVELPGPLPAGTTATFVVEFYDRERRGFTTPTYLADASPPRIEPSWVEGAPVVTRVVPLANGSALVEFSTVLGARYVVEYSDDAVEWLASAPEVVGNGTRLQWLDQGPPRTVRLPEGKRFYRVLRLPAP